jgi:hypothetical protein
VTNLQVIGGLPCVAYRQDSGGAIFFSRSYDAAGTTWHYPVVAWQREGASAGPTHLTLAQFDGHAALAVVDSRDGTLWYTEATDPLENQWQLPLCVASYTQQHVVSSPVSLLNLNGVAAMVHDDFLDFTTVQLRVTRLYR